jgi:hypothetical protein
MKTCDYCGRENSEDAVRCQECGSIEWKKPPMLEASNATPSSNALVEEPEPAFISTQGNATIIHCRTSAEADLVMKKFQAADIVALVPVDHSNWQRVRGATGILPIQVSTRALTADKDLHDCVTFAYDPKMRAGHPLPSVMKIIAFLLPLLFPIGMFLFILEATGFKNQGFQKRARDWARWFGIGMAAWATIIALMVIYARCTLKPV